MHSGLSRIENGAFSLGTFPWRHLFHTISAQALASKKSHWKQFQNPPPRSAGEGLGEGHGVWLNLRSPRSNLCLIPSCARRPTHFMSAKQGCIGVSGRRSFGQFRNRLGLALLCHIGPQWTEWLWRFGFVNPSITTAVSYPPNAFGNCESIGIPSGHSLT